MKTKRNVFIVLTTLVIVVLAVLGYMFLQQGVVPEGMREVKSYEKDALCIANGPQCGICPEKVIGDKCYVQKGTYEYFE
jgi:hypothetical protein